MFLEHLLCGRYYSRLWEYHEIVIDTLPNLLEPLLCAILFLRGHLNNYSRSSLKLRINVLPRMKHKTQV